MNRLKKLSRGAVVSVAVCAILIFLYVLSVAPVQWLQSHGYLAGGYWQSISVYRPLVWFSGEVTLAARVLDWYSTLLAAPPYRVHGGVI